MNGYSVQRINRVSVVLFLSVFMFVVSCFFVTQRVLAQETSSANNVDTSPFAQLYDPIKGEPIERREVFYEMLVVMSLGPVDEPYYQDAKGRLERLKDILESHWHVNIKLTDIKDLSPGFSKNNDIVMVVEEYNGMIDGWMVNELTTNYEGKLVWSGYQSNLILSRLGLGNSYSIDSESRDFPEVYYEGVNFDGRAITVFDDLPCPSADETVDVLARVIDNEGNKVPLICSVNKKVYILPFEIPYEYATDDYSLVFLDLFHHIIEPHKKHRQAFLRLEDVDPYTHRNARYLKRVYKILKQWQAPFHIALIARYINPDTNEDVSFGDKPGFQKMITKMTGEGLGVLVQHGYTHQYGDSISGYGYEFWDDDNDTPVEEDSVDYVRDKITAAQALMNAQGMPAPDIWETPHYTMSELDSQVINQYYPLRYGDMSDLGSLPMTASVGGVILLPENLGYVETEADVFAIQKRLDQINVFDDPIASFFWHPWRNTWELEELLNAFSMSGYEFVSVYDTVTPTPASGYYLWEQFRQEYAYNWRQQITDVWVTVCFVVFSLGALVYIRNRIMIARYLKHICTFKMSVDKLESYYSKHGKKRLPKIVILVPARNEARVIGNTIKRLVEMDYPKNRYRIVIVVDAREKAEGKEATTKEIVQQLSGKLNQKWGEGLVRFFEVPKWYSGDFGSKKKTYAKSTKGRALNWALQQMKENKRWKGIEMIGVVDADGRLDPNVLKEVTYKRLAEKAKVLQGPVFQVSNFGSVSFTGIAAGLELAIYHLTDLPHRLISKKENPFFLAGTNYFIDKNLLFELGGLNKEALVEDAELALRIFVEKGITAKWISWPEVEQTPATTKVYWRQRERWAMGHLQLVPMVMKSPIPLVHKLRFSSLIYFNLFRVIIDLGIPILSWMLVLSGVLLDLGPGWRELSILLLIMSVFIWDYYGYMYRTLVSLGYVNKNGVERRVVRMRDSLFLILYMPVFIVIQALPRISAAYKLIFHKSYQWYKTERTVEMYEK